MKKFTDSEIMAEIPSVIDNCEIDATVFSVAELYFLMQATQLTVTHPNLSQSMKQRMEAVGRRCQKAIRGYVSKAFAEFMEAGWHREFDR